MKKWFPILFSSLMGYCASVPTIHSYPDVDFIVADAATVSEVCYGNGEDDYGVKHEKNDFVGCHHNSITLDGGIKRHEIYLRRGHVEDDIFHELCHYFGQKTGCEKYDN